MASRRRRVGAALSQPSLSSLPSEILHQIASDLPRGGAELGRFARASRRTRDVARTVTYDRHYCCAQPPTPREVRDYLRRRMVEPLVDELINAADEDALASIQSSHDVMAWMTNDLPASPDDDDWRVFLSVGRNESRDALVQLIVSTINEDEDDEIESTEPIEVVVRFQSNAVAYADAIMSAISGALRDAAAVVPGAQDYGVIGAPGDAYMPRSARYATWDIGDTNAILFEPRLYYDVFRRRVVPPCRHVYENDRNLIECAMYLGLQMVMSLDRRVTYDDWTSDEALYYNARLRVLNQLLRFVSAPSPPQ